MTFGRKYGRIAWTQLMRRLPVNLRPLLLVPRGRNPKGLGLFLGGYAKLYRSDPQPAYLRNIHDLLDLLEKLRSPGYAGSCWGYNFDWQSRAFFIPKYTPTVVNSSFIGHALMDTWETVGEQRALDMAVSIKDFLLRDLHRTAEGETFCFSYTPIDRTAVHNANLLGASLLIRLYKI
ncbi:MAG: delta-aminolevulinic acid dehydratase, partial [Deltaproteobacteria bacterium]|nr:delta-aminolevulinic acid dehydratase [Candidatus Tharpellaceae bacterium]